MQAPGSEGRGVEQTVPWRPQRGHGSANTLIWDL